MDQGQHQTGYGVVVHQQTLETEAPTSYLCIKGRTYSADQSPPSR